MVSRPRRAGSRWRILVHEISGERRAHDVTSDPRSPDLTSHVVLEGTEFDELVIGRWIHLEQMDTGRWWCNFGGVTINITADRDGRPKVVDVSGPGDYGEAVEGCRYSLTWSADDGDGSETAATRGTW